MTAFPNPRATIRTVECRHLPRRLGRSRGWRKRLSASAPRSRSAQRLEQNGLKGATASFLHIGRVLAFGAPPSDDDPDIEPLTRTCMEPLRSLPWPRPCGRVPFAVFRRVPRSTARFRAPRERDRLSRRGAGGASTCRSASIATSPGARKRPWPEHAGQLSPICSGARPLRVISTRPAWDIGETAAGRAVLRQALGERLQHKVHMPRLFHMDKVGDDQPADAAQADLAAQLARRFEVHSQRRVLPRRELREASLN